MKFRYLAAFLFSLLFCFSLTFSFGKRNKKKTEPAVTEELVSLEQEEELADFDENGDFSYKHELPDGEPLEFREVWGYVVSGREGEFRPDMPITDLVYFSADVNCYGEFDSIPKASVFKDFKGRKHLSVTCQSRSLTHFVLDPQYGVVNKMIATLTAAAKDYDGINIDFELIPKRDVKNFRDFVRKLRRSLGEVQWLTIAVPARTRTLENDAFDYAALAPYVDRVFIMAYDEHWSTSQPGAIANTDWGKRIAEYAMSVLPQKKLVMGLPFYGRTWQDESFGQAWYFSGVNRIMGENKVRHVERDEGVPHFTFKKQIQVTGYFEDTYSAVTKCRAYKELGCERIGFWRIGQEDPSFWDWIKIK